MSIGKWQRIINESKSYFWKIDKSLVKTIRKNSERERERENTN
jgi:hypothetical protein